MKRRRSKKEIELDKRLRFATDNTYKCKCGHSIVIYPSVTRKLCHWCGHYVYKSKKDEFLDRFKKELRKEKNDE